MTDELGKMPDATTERPESYPGGVDSIDDPKYGLAPGRPTSADADPDHNPAVVDATPDEVRQPEEPLGGASTDGASEPESDSPA